MKFLNILLLLIILCFFNTKAFSNENKKDCTEIKNLIKKLECKVASSTNSITSKVNVATEGITNKKTFADFFKKKK